MAVYRIFVYYFQLLVVIITLHKTSGQCFPTSCMTSCSEDCYPNVWERDLCTYYRQISLWRASAERCGLSLPDPPDRSAQLSPQMSWDLAKQYWEEIVVAWQRAALANGILNPQQVGTMVGDTDSLSMPGSGVTANSMDFGSGDISSGGDILTPTTPEPPTSPVLTTQLSEWLDSTLTWERQLTQWESFVKSESGLQLPDSSISDVIDSLNNSTQASAVRENSDKWISLLNDWEQRYSVYTNRFNGLCPNL